MTTPEVIEVEAPATVAVIEVLTGALGPARPPSIYISPTPPENPQPNQL